MNEAELRNKLQDYSRGSITAREVLKVTGLPDYAALIMAISQHDLALPRKSATPDHVRRATEILQPLLRQDAF